MSDHRKEQEAKIMQTLKRRSMGITRLETAKLLGIPKSSQIAKILNDMATRDLLVIKRGVDSRRRNVFIYYPNHLRGGK
jgi:hypothetical protein